MEIAEVIVDGFYNDIYQASDRNESGECSYAPTTTSHVISSRLALYVK